MHERNLILLPQIADPGQHHQRACVKGTRIVTLEHRQSHKQCSGNRVVAVGLRVLEAE